MQEEKTEGIVLRSQDYKERHRIITLFSPQGLISLIVKGISQKNARLLALTTPFSYGEYIYRQGNSELFRFQDGTLLNDYFTFRQHLKFLDAAGTLANAVLSSQMAGKPAPALFALYKSYHSQVASFDDPMPLTASFFLKLLKYEGLLSISAHCSSCGAGAQCLSNGESLCSQHADKDAIAFSFQEWEILLSLDSAQQFSALRSFSIPSHLPQKIQTLFLSRLI